MEGETGVRAAYDKDKMVYKSFDFFSLVVPVVVQRYELVRHLLLEKY